MRTDIVPLRLSFAAVLARLNVPWAHSATVDPAVPQVCVPRAAGGGGETDEPSARNSFACCGAGENVGCKSQVERQARAGSIRGPARCGAPLLYHAPFAYRPTNRAKRLNMGACTHHICSALPPRSCEGGLKYFSNATTLKQISLKPSPSRRPVVELPPREADGRGDQPAVMLLCLGPLRPPTAGASHLQT